MGPWGEGRDRSGGCSKKREGKEKKRTSGESAIERAVGDSTLHETDITVYPHGPSLRWLDATDDGESCMQRDGREW